ncbi:MAG: DUF4954 family protein, partial [Muribaculaceae bacterium]|nr:DUF4954 family protein [Muribaculaceae bacterium]
MNPTNANHDRHNSGIASLARIDGDTIRILEAQGCSAENWNSVFISEKVNLNDIRNVRFGGTVRLDDGAVVRNVPGGICNCRV